jgi:heme A synthase
VGGSRCRRDALRATAGWARSLSLDLLAQWQGLEVNGQFRFTPPTHAILAFDQALRPSLTNGFTRLAMATTATVYAVLVSGVLVSRPGALMRCLNWPGVVGLGGHEDLFGWLYLLRFALGVLASVLIAVLVVQVWRTRRRQVLLVRDTTIAGILLVIATLVGALMPSPDNGILMPAMSMAVAVALWAVLVAVVMRSGRCISGDV